MKGTDFCSIFAFKQSHEHLKISPIYAVPYYMLHDIILYYILMSLCHNMIGAYVMLLKQYLVLSGTSVGRVSDSPPSLIQISPSQGL